MDLAYSYDHLVNTDDRAATPTPPNPASTADDTQTTDPATPKAARPQPRQNLQTEFQETFKAFSNSPWGAKLGGLWGNVRKQGESYYEEAVREAEAARIDAVKGFSDLREGIAGRVRSLSVSEAEALDETEGDTTRTKPVEKSEPIPGEEPIPNADDQARVLRDNENFLERLKAEAAKRLKDVQSAEDAADDALLKFGTNIRNFLREVVAVTAPEDSEQQGEVLFESRDASGRRTIHASRMDAQLHLIHTSPSRFTQDTADSGDEWESFCSAFDINKKTDEIAQDLERYPELRRTMEALVPEQVDYTDFWGRYYFLRQALEAQEQKRRELLKATANDTEEQVAWDEDSDADDEDTTTTSKSSTAPQTTAPPKIVMRETINTRNDSSTTLTQTQTPTQTAPAPTAAVAPGGGGGGLKPAEGRRSHDEKSVADSEASYDIVSGAPSRAAESPEESPKEGRAEESDEDWE